MNTWLQMHFTVARDDTEQLSESLEADGALSVTYSAGDDSMQYQLQPNETPLWHRVIVTALFSPQRDADAIIASLINQSKINKETTYTHEILEEKDWVSETQRQFQAQRFADRLWVVPGWDKTEYPQPCCRIDPGLAFGTGTHPTTALCLAWLAENPPCNQTVIDFGCGSGILSLAACALGALSVYAVDHDEQAIQATEQNAALNASLADRLCVGKSAILPVDLTAPVVIANILAAPLLSLYPTLLQHTESNGVLVLSGLLISDKDSIVRCYSAGFDLVDCKAQDEWLRLVFTKKSNASG